MNCITTCSMKGLIPVEMYDTARAISYFYFENMLMLIIVLWLIKWLFAYQGGYSYE